MIHVIISLQLLMNHISSRSEMDSESELPTGRRELKIGDSLKNNGTSFHGIKYDFKPSNEEYNESAMVEITSTNQVTLKYPQTDESTSDFMYSGTVRQFPKEYFLVVDQVTGEVTLEKLTANIQLKRTKVVSNKTKNQNIKKLELEKECSASPELNDTPSTSKKKTKRKQKTRELTITDPKLVNKKYGLIPQHSPLHPSPSRTSPNESKNPSTNSDYKVSGSTNSPEASSSQRSLLSAEDDESSMTGFESKFPINLPQLINMPPQDNDFGLSAIQAIGSISESSSDSSSDSDSNSDSSSSSSSGTKKKPPQKTRVNGYPINSISPPGLKAGQLLNEDLQLSETGSDSD